MDRFDIDVSYREPGDEPGPGRDDMPTGDEVGPLTAADRGRMASARVPCGCRFTGGGRQVVTCRFHARMARDEYQRGYVAGVRSAAAEYQLGKADAIQPQRGGQLDKADAIQPQPQSEFGGPDA